MGNARAGWFRAAAVQESSVWLDRAASTEKACALIEQAGAGGADIVALPESFVPGFPYWVFVKPLGETAAWHARLHEQAVEIPGPEVDALTQAARRAGVVAVVGITEREPGSVGTLFNTNIVVSPDGYLGRHRKLVPTWGERVVWTGGDGSTLGVFPTPFGPLGTLNCGENLNPLARYALLAQGERIHVANFPSAAVAGARHSREELFLHVAPHAYEGKVFSICCSEYGTVEVAAELGVPFEVPDGTYNCISGIVGPNGEWVSRPLVDERGIVYADCELEAILQGRLFHDIVGHYNRFDVLHLEVDRAARSPMVVRDAERGSETG
ncbi:MAG: carbon-nitrogen hydrolase family protein [Gaiellales bacterium]